MVLIIGIPISWGIGGFGGTEDPAPRTIEAGGWDLAGEAVALGRAGRLRAASAEVAGRPGAGCERQPSSLIFLRCRCPEAPQGSPGDPDPIRTNVHCFCKEARWRRLSDYRRHMINRADNAATSI